MYKNNKASIAQGEKLETQTNTSGTDSRNLYINEQFMHQYFKKMYTFNELEKQLNSELDKIKIIAEKCQSLNNEQVRIREEFDQLQSKKYSIEKNLAEEAYKENQLTKKHEVWVMQIEKEIARLADVDRRNVKIIETVLETLKLCEFDEQQGKIQLEDKLKDLSETSISEMQNTSEGLALENQLPKPVRGTLDAAVSEVNPIEISEYTEYRQYKIHYSKLQQLRVIAEASLNGFIRRALIFLIGEKYLVYSSANGIYKGIEWPAIPKNVKDVIQEIYADFNLGQTQTLIDNFDNVADKYIDGLRSKAGLRGPITLREAEMTMQKFENM